MRLFYYILLASLFFFLGCENTTSTPINSEEENRSPHVPKEQTSLSPQSLDECAKAILGYRSDPKMSCLYAKHSDGKACVYENATCIPATACAQLGSTQCDNTAIANMSCFFDASASQCVRSTVCEDIQNLNECDNQATADPLGAKCRVMPINGVKKCVTYPVGKYTKNTLWKIIAGPEAVVVEASYHAIESRKYFLTFGKNTKGLFSIPADIKQVLGLASEYGCGWTKDEIVKCWGDGSGGRTNPPNYKFSSIKLNDQYACGLIKDGEPNAHKIACWGTLPASVNAKVVNGFITLSYKNDRADTFRDFALSDNQLCAVTKLNMNPYALEALEQYGALYRNDPRLPNWFSANPGFILCSNGQEFSWKPAFYPHIAKLSSSNNNFCGIMDAFSRHEAEKAFCWESAEQAQNMKKGSFFMSGALPSFSRESYVEARISDNFGCFLKKANNDEFKGTLECFDKDGNKSTVPPAAVGEIKLNNFSLGSNFACATKEGKIHCWGPGASTILDTVPKELKP